MNEEIEDLQLEIQGFASCLDRDELFIVCEKLNIDRSSFEGKSRFATVKVLTREIENLVALLNDTEKAPFLKQTLDMINLKAMDAEVANSACDLDQEERPEMNRETLRHVEKQKSPRETMRLQIITGASKVEYEPDYSETGLGNLRSILRRDFRILGTIGSQGSKDQLSFISLSRQIENGQEKG